MLKFGDLGYKILKTNLKFEISTFKIGYKQNFVEIRNLYSLTQNAHIWGFGLKLFENQCQA